MPSNFTNLTVIWYDHSDSYVTSADITKDVVGIPLFSDTGTGEVNSCNITVKAPYGRRITSISPVSIDAFDRFEITLDDISGNSYSRFYEVQKILPGSDKNTGTILELECLGIEYHTQVAHYSRQFWFRAPSVPSTDIGDTYNDNKGTIQPLLSGHDSNSYDPDTASGNGLPTFTQGIYDYGVNPAFCYDIWMDLVDRQGAAVAGGGVFDFFELGFDTPSVNEIIFRCFSSGSTPESKTTNNTIVTIENTITINPSETEGDIENQTGTIVYVMGDPRSGALQKGREVYNSGIFQFSFRPEWSNIISYSTDAKILYQGQHYMSLIDNNLNNTPPGPTTCSADTDSNWTQIDMSDKFGDSSQYSEWTDDKAALFLNGMISPDKVTEASQVFTSIGAKAFDGNIVINANGFLRTWVTDRTSSIAPIKTLSNEYFYSDSPLSLFYRGYRFLNVGDGVFQAGEKDLNGIEFKNSVIEVITNPNPAAESNLVFVVKYKLDSTTDNMQIVSLFEGIVWEWDSNTETFTDITSTDLGGDCLHQFNTLENSTSFDPKPAETNCVDFPEITKDGTTFSTNIDSSIKIVYDFNSVISDRITNQTAYQSHGAWFNMRFPYPYSIFNDIDEGVGGIYGGGTTLLAKSTATIDSGEVDSLTLDTGGSGYNDTPDVVFVGGGAVSTPATATATITNGVVTGITLDTGGAGYTQVPKIFFVNSGGTGLAEPATLDISNMGYTPKGFLGYNQDDSDRLSKLVSFSFTLGLKIELRSPTGGALTVLDGTANIRILMGDTNDNVWSFDFELPTTDGVMYPIDTEISAYSVIRGHKPRYFALNNLIDLINPKEIDNQNIFEQRNISWIVIQHQDQYDDFGRFAPEGNLNDLSNTSLSAALGGKITLTIDDLHFKKALVVNTGPTSDMNIEPDMIHRQDIMLFDQAKEVADSELQIEQFRHKEFNLTTTGDSIFDIRFGDSFFLRNRRLVSDSEQPIVSADLWDNGIDYVVGDIVTQNSLFYEAIQKSVGQSPATNLDDWTETTTVLNTIKLVAKKIEYSISRPQAGKGGLERRIKGVKRF